MKFRNCFWPVFSERVKHLLTSIIMMKRWWRWCVCVCARARVCVCVSVCACVCVLCGSHDEVHEWMTHLDVGVCGGGGVQLHALACWCVAREGRALYIQMTCDHVTWAQPNKDVKKEHAIHELSGEGRLVGERGGGGYFRYFRFWGFDKLRRYFAILNIYFFKEIVGIYTLKFNPKWNQRSPWFCIW